MDESSSDMMITVEKVRVETRPFEMRLVDVRVEKRLDRVEETWK